jgi:glycosyltransferase involved in cell wall biosynthesis
MPGRIGFAGRFNDPRKNIGLLLGAVAQLRTRGSDVSLTLMGEVPETEILDHVARLQLKSHVAFRPGLSRAQMRDLMQTLDVFVLPSHQEGLCIAALEAMACGVPVVSTRCGGPEEFVIPGQTGLLVDSRPSAMADAIASILDDEVRRNAMGASARQLIQERYGLERMDTIFTQAFKSAFPQIHGRRPAHEHLVPIEANESVA